MKRNSVLELCTLLGGLLFLSLPTASFAQVQYAITDLGTLLGEASSCAWAMNNSGQVVGVAHTSSGPEHAFLYSGSGPMQDLSALVGSSWNIATDINNSGQIVGCNGDSAWLYAPSGPLQNLSSLNEKFRYATAINNSGQVVGGAGGVW